jgi:hypothetical protein
MSGLISGLVLRQPINGEFTSEAKFVAVVYADHAWEDGSHAYPAIATVATITGYSDRTVQRYLRVLERLGILVATGKGPRGTIAYSFPLAAGKDGSVRLAPVNIAKSARGDSVTPRQADGGDTESGDRDSGDTGDTRINHPSFKEEEEKDAKKPEFSMELQNKLQQAGIYMQIWPEISARLKNGWTEGDVMALLNWMRRTNLDSTRAAQRAVARIREGTKAPEQYYPLDLAGEEIDADENPDDGPNFSTPAGQAWQAVITMLQREMPKSSFDTYVSTTRVVNFQEGLYTIEVPDAASRDWLTDRLTSTLKRSLQGIFNRIVDVRFVVGWRKRSYRRLS